MVKYTGVLFITIIIVASFQFFLMPLVYLYKELDFSADTPFYMDSAFYFFKWFIQHILTYV